MQKQLVFFILAAAAFAIVLGYAAQPFIRTSEQLNERVNVGGAAPQSSQPIDKAYLLLPAVDESGRGKMAELIVEMRQGSGKVFIAFEEDAPLLSPETQESLKIAIQLGKLLATRDASKVDLHYTMNAPSSIVGGKSAGAAVAVATVALLQGISLRADVAISGGVDEQGNVLRVGGVLEKARAVRDAGFSKFVVPRGESTAFVVREECVDEPVAGGVFRRCASRTIPVDISKEVGIELVEVDNVQQAIGQMRA